MARDVFVLEATHPADTVYHKVRLERSITGAVRLYIGSRLALEAYPDEPGRIVFHQDDLRAQGFDCEVD